MKNEKVKMEAVPCGRFVTPAAKIEEQDSTDIGMGRITGGSVYFAVGVYDYKYPEKKVDISTHFIHNSHRGYRQ